LSRASNLRFSWEYQSPQEFFAEEEEEDNRSNAAKLRYHDFYKFLDFSRGLFEKYYDVVRKFDFLKFALGSSFDAGTVALEYTDTSEFIDACISLEALYNDGGSDLKYKISLRLAFLLGFDDFPPMTTFYNADKIYNKRSSVVHGGGYNPEGVYIEQTKSYARRSCICFLILCHKRINQFSNEKSKGILLKEIDRAMLEREKRSELEQEIVKGIAKDFKPKFKVRRDESQSRKRDLSVQKNS
jgi:hypothetical protein